MICPKCNKPLIVDDEDYSFKGCFDQWLICKNPNCHIHGFRKVRYNKCILEELSEYDENTNISKISNEDILKYLDHEEYVFDWAFDYIQKNKKYIGENLKDNDVKNEYLTSILNNKNHPLHKAREIRISLEKIAASTVHVYIYKNDIAFDFKYDKTSLMYSVSNSYISTYNMSVPDRRKYEKQFGKYTDFNFNDIYKIEYRNKPIYVDQNYESSLKKEYTL